MSPLMSWITCDIGHAVCTGRHPLPPGDNSKREKSDSFALREDVRLIHPTL